MWFLLVFEVFNGSFKEEFFLLVKAIKWLLWGLHINLVSWINWQFFLHVSLRFVGIFLRQSFVDFMGLESSLRLNWFNALRFWGLWSEVDEFFDISRWIIVVDALIFAWFIGWNYALKIFFRNTLRSSETFKVSLRSL